MRYETKHEKESGPVILECW